MNIENLTDEELCSLIQKNENEDKALSELSKRHINLVSHIANRVMKKEELFLKKIEIIERSKYFIYLVAKKYNKSKKTKFSTLLGNEVKWACYNIFNDKKNNRIQNIEITPATTPACESFIEDFDKDDLLSFIFKSINKTKDKRVKKIFKLRYKEGLENKVMPWRLISKEVGISIQGCINLHNQTIKKLKRVINNEQSYSNWQFNS